MLQTIPHLRATTILGELQRRYPGRYPDRLLPSLQRRVASWSSPCHRPDQFPALRRHELEEQLRRCEANPRPLFSALECILSTTLNIFERCYSERHSLHFNVSMLRLRQ